MRPYKRAFMKMKADRMLDLACNMGRYMMLRYPHLNPPKIKIEWDRSLFPEKRDSAYTDGETITLSDKMLELPIENQIALIAHELSHLQLLQDDIEHSERFADSNAEKIFGIKIYYDADDIQTTKTGHKRPRPQYLPK